MMKKNLLLTAACAATFSGLAAVGPVTTLWKANDNGVKMYRIPALCTAPNGDLVAACDARQLHGGDLNSNQPINITVRRSTDGGQTWTAPVHSHTWTWDDTGHWAGSDPSFVVDAQAKKIFLFYNVWECKGNYGVYQFWVQESSDNGVTWSAPRDISKDIAFDAWPFGQRQNAGGFIFISSGSGVQMKDGTLVHTLVHVGDGNALFGSTDHGKTWKAIGRPAKGGDECKVIELADGSWMINSRCGGRKRLIHRSSDRGETWTSAFDTALVDPGCNAQILRYDAKTLLFSNCNSGGRNNLFLRTSTDEGATWSKGLSICKGASAYSDLAVLPNGDVAVLYEGAGYATVDFVVVPAADVKADAKAE